MKRPSASPARPVRRPPDPRSPSHRPWHPTAYTTDDISALQALATGTANGPQQVRALRWIVEGACAVDQPTFIADSDRETVFAEAKRHVGLEIKKLVGLPANIVKGLRDKERQAVQRGD